MSNSLQDYMMRQEKVVTGHMDLLCSAFRFNLHWLVLAGHADDESRLAALKKQAQDLGIDDAVSFEM